MKKNLKAIYIFEIVMLIFTIIFKMVVLDNYRKYVDIVNILFWLILVIIMLIRFNFPRNKHYLKSTTIRLIIINLFSFLLLVYIIGIFPGFTKYVYAHDIINIIKNTFPVIVIIITQEIIRFIVSKNSENNLKPLIFLTIIYISLSIVMEISYYNFYSIEQAFKFLSIICLPIIAKQLIYSYITYKVSLTPTIILRIAYEIYIFIFPFFPKLSEYLLSVVGVIFPYIIYCFLSKTIQYAEKSNLYIKKVFKNIFLIPIAIFLVILIILISGIFKYQLIAIGSNSMIPVYERGDAVLFEKISNKKTIKKGDILVFYRNETVMTHRVVLIKKENNKLIFKTKGDNNEELDQFDTEENKVLGVVKYKVKYIGYPTIWLTESFNK